MPTNPRTFTIQVKMPAKGQPTQVNTRVGTLKILAKVDTQSGIAQEIDGVQISFAPLAQNNDTTWSSTWFEATDNWTGWIPPSQGQTSPLSFDIPAALTYLVDNYGLDGDAIQPGHGFRFSGQWDGSSNNITDGLVGVPAAFLFAYGLNWTAGSNPDQPDGAGSGQGGDDDDNTTWSGSNS